MSTERHFTEPVRRLLFGRQPKGAPVLTELERAARELAEVEARRDELIAEALRLGFSERQIGRAADMSGPAIHQRKRGGSS